MKLFNSPDNKILLSTSAGSLKKNHYSRVQAMIDFLDQFVLDTIENNIEVLYESGAYNFRIDEKFPSHIIPIKYHQFALSQKKNFALQAILGVPSAIQKIIFLGNKDVTISSTIRGGLLGVIIKNLKRTKMLVYDDMDYYPYFYKGKETRNLVKQLEKRIISASDMIFCASRSLMNLRQKENPSKKYFFSPNGVDTQLFKDAWKPEKNYKNVLIYSGSLDPSIWCTNFLIEILKELNKYKKVKLLMIGGGFYLNELNKLAKEKNIQDKVFFTGGVPHDDLPMYFQMGDIGLAIGRPNSAAEFADPIKVKEYMAAGLPVIGTKVGDIPCVINECNSGLVSDFDLESIVSQILNLLEDKRLYNEMSHEARMNVAKKYSWHHLFSRMFEIILNEYVDNI